MQWIEQPRVWDCGDYQVTQYRPDENGSTFYAKCRRHTMVYEGPFSSLAAAQEACQRDHEREGERK